MVSACNALLSAHNARVLIFERNPTRWLPPAAAVAAAFCGGGSSQNTCGGGKVIMMNECSRSTGNPKSGVLRRESPAESRPWSPQLMGELVACCSRVA